MSRHAFPDVADLVRQWSAARGRTFDARYLRAELEQPADYWTELRTAAAISREVLAGRWCAVAALLRLGAVESWAQVGETFGVTETDARDGFEAWLSGQVDLFQRTQSLGVSPAEAHELRELAERVVP